MSETTSSPQDRDEGEEQDTFVGGEFGHSDNVEDGHLTSAQQTGADREQEAHLADPDQSASTTQESVVDVEGTGTEPAPGDRNEPV